MQFTLNRNYTLKTGTGYIVDFVKNEPTFVPQDMHKAALAIGAEAVGAKLDVLEDDPATKLAPQGAEREAAIVTAIQMMVEENTAGDFTANGRPNIKRIEALVDFDIDSEERDAVWAKIKAGE